MLKNTPLPDDHIDAVLCLGGPVSHLPDPAQRTRAVEELARVATRAAPLFISVFNRFALYRFTPSVFVEFLRSRGLLVERLYGTNGLGAHLQEENLQALMADPTRWERGRRRCWRRATTLR